LLAKVEAVLSQVLEAHGLELVDAQWRREGRRWALRFFVDKVGGAGIADCQRFSHEAGDVLDVSGLLTESYDLEVSSPGLDRELRKDREFVWAVGKDVRCWEGRGFVWGGGGGPGGAGGGSRWQAGSSSRGVSSRRRRSGWSSRLQT